MDSNQDHRSGQCCCPLCAAWSAYRRSEAAQHVRNIQRESWLLARSVISACLGMCETRRTPPAPEQPPEPPLY